MNKEYIYPFLEDLQSRIDTAQEDRLWAEWTAFADGEYGEKPFVPTPRECAPPKIVWEQISINAALGDRDKMIVSQLAICSKMLENGSDKIMQIRPNYGIGILPSLFGVEPFIMSEEANTLPNVRPFKNGIEDIRAMVEQPVPDLNLGYGADVFAFGENMLELFADFPVLSKYIFLEHPDCQGPMDVCELLWGSEIFLDLYDEPELAHRALEKISDTYEAFLGRWFDTIKRPMGYHTYGFKLHKGNIVVRDDSAMNMSPDFYKEFIGPYNERVLKFFGGGGIHFCGRGEHFIEPMSQIDGLFAVDMSQPHLNNMPHILENTINKGINLFTPRGDYADNVNFAEYKQGFLYSV